MIWEGQAKSCSHALTRNNRLFMLANFLFALSYGLWMNLRQLHLGDLGATPAEVGTALGAVSLAGALLPVPAGLLTDRFGPKRVMLAAWGMAVAGALIAALATTPTEAPGRLDLDVWFNISDLMGLEAQNPTMTFLTVKRHDAPLNQIERHCRTAEFFIPLQGKSAIMVAPMSDPNDPDAMPDESKLRVFHLDGSAGIAFPRGGWHWAPVPLGESATFLLIFDRDILNDIQIWGIAEQRLMPSG